MVMVLVMVRVVVVMFLIAMMNVISMQMAMVMICMLVLISLHILITLFMRCANGCLNVCRFCVCVHVARHGFRRYVGSNTLVKTHVP